MKPVLSTEEVVRLEDIIEREGTSKAELMELAGEFAANEVLKLNPDRSGTSCCSSYCRPRCARLRRPLA